MEIRTLDYYNKNAVEYAKKTFDVDMHEICNRFIDSIKPGGRILDLGCGSGRDSLFFKKQGFDVVAVDGSKELCKIASEKTGLQVQELLFENLDFDEEFDGIWTCASLLHVESKELPFIFEKIRKSLIHEGVFYTCFKYGDTEEVCDGKHYTNLTEEKIRALLLGQGFEILELFITKDSMADRSELKWINAIAIKR